MHSRFLIGALLTASALLASPVPSGAERPQGGGGAYVGDDGNPTAEAHEGPSGGGDGGPPSPAGGDGQCEWRVLIEDDFEWGIYDANFTRLHSATGRWLGRWCDGRGPLPVGYQDTFPEGGLVDPHQLALDALASVPITQPDIRTSPSENGRLYVQVTTWMWLGGDWWRTYEATARAGRVWSTVRASPVQTTWSTGDGNTILCHGPGTAWQPGMSEDATDCSHTYRYSSAGEPDGRFTLEATVTIEISWSSNATGGGTLPAITRTSSVKVEVGEIQAIGTRGGS